METITDMEKEALFEARRSFWDALVNSLGEEEAKRLFANLDGDTIDYITYAVWSGIRVSMRRQSAVGAVPVPLADQPTWMNATHHQTDDLNDDIPPF